ncbi:hypothetical protein, partial [Lacticaseibacillus paracasei]|uniref:hypothetical protein n=1 Tax=Lacticaseibacillus paracasei TaxID=1597 RepID=UPI0023611C46
MKNRRSRLRDRQTAHPTRIGPFPQRRPGYDGAMPTLLQVSTIAQTIQLSLAPVFMLAAIGQILNVLA